jgi:hypothetical protein
MMRRTIRTILHRLIGAPLLLTALLPMGAPVAAEEAPADIVSIVTELGPGDLLNIRATPSPVGRTQARLPGGTSVKNYGCSDVNGHRWCKVEEIDNPQVKGWAPARYLIPDNPAVVEVDAVPAPQASAEAAGTASAVDQPSETSANAPAAAPAPDLTDRFGDTDPGAPKSAAAIGRTAVQDAYDLAFAANENLPISEIPDVNPQTIARLEPAPAPDAVGGIPCARQVGQPMTRCEVSVAHSGGDSAVTVTWPDGGTRIISFHDGLPVGSDSSDEFRFTREGKLNMIRVGVSERFEITDTQTLGD